MQCDIQKLVIIFLSGKLSETGDRTNKGTD